MANLWLNSSNSKIGLTHYQEKEINFDEKRHKIHEFRRIRRLKIVNMKLSRRKDLMELQI
ncbi:2329_t:CDS:2 [Rhizophagus irregularis]|nr:2329_t:CDS:2 [Rhizophagus irregularis]